MVVGAAAALCAHVVAHVRGHTDVVYQRCHGVNLGLAACRGQRVGHGEPLVVGVAEVGREHAVADASVVADVGVGAVARGGMVPVFHYLRRRRGHAARHGQLTVDGVVGAVGVVVRALVPGGRQHGRHVRRQRLLGGHALLQQAPLGGHGGGHGVAVGSALGAVLDGFGTAGYLAVVALKPRPDVGGHRLGTEDARRRVAQHGAHAVVGGDKHEAAARGIEDIHPGEGGRHSLQLHIAGSAFQRQPVGTHPAGTLRVDRIGHGTPRRHNGNKRQKEPLRYVLRFHLDQV